MSQLSDKHLPAVINAARSAGIPLGELKPVNPFTQQGKRATLLQASLEAVDPVACAQLRGEAGLGSTLETAAVRAGLIEMTPTAHAALMASDGDYAQEQRDAAIQRELDQLEAWDRQAKEMARNQVIRQHGGDTAAADRFLRQQEEIEQSKAEQKARDEESARQMNQRIAQRQEADRRMARAQGIVVSGVTQ